MDSYSVISGYYLKLKDNQEPVLTKKKMPKSIPVDIVTKDVISSLENKIRELQSKLSSFEEPSKGSYEVAVSRGNYPMHLTKLAAKLGSLISDDPLWQGFEDAEIICVNGLDAHDPTLIKVLKKLGKEAWPPKTEYTIVKIDTPFYSIVPDLEDQDYIIVKDSYPWIDARIPSSQLE